MDVNRVDLFAILYYMYVRFRYIYSVEMLMLKKGSLKFTLAKIDRGSPNL